MSLLPTSLHPLTRHKFLRGIANHTLVTADTPLPSACHCEPVLGPPQRGTLCGERSAKGALLPRWPSAGITTGPRKAARFVGKGDPRERCPALAFGRSWAWRTLGRRGAAIRIPAVTQDNEQYLRRIHNRLRICPGRTLLQTLTPYKFLHVIARSEATWQSVLFAAQHNGK